MKVKNYIEALRKLDPERELWVGNDDYLCAWPIITPKVVDKETARWYKNPKMKEGDYIIM